MNYSQYRNEVLLKADGATIHKVNGNLGIVQNALLNRDYFEKAGDTHMQERCQEILDTALFDIFKLTGTKLPINLQKDPKKA